MLYTHTNICMHIHAYVSTSYVFCGIFLTNLLFPCQLLRFINMIERSHTHLHTSSSSSCTGKCSFIEIKFFSASHIVGCCFVSRKVHALVLHIRSTNFYRRFRYEGEGSSAVLSLLVSVIRACAEHSLGVVMESGKTWNSGASFASWLMRPMYLYTKSCVLNWTHIGPVSYGILCQAWLDHIWRSE